MKKLFASGWLAAYLMGWLPNGIFGLGAKTPWYRQGWMRFAPYIAGALIAPLVLFLGWKGFQMLSRPTQQQKG